MSQSIIQKYRVKPSANVKLSRWKAEDKSIIKDRKEAEKKIEALRRELVELQYRLSAGHRHKVLVILQGMDTAGKDGTIRHVFQGVNPQIVDVSSFKVPSQKEADHDYLWRVHQKTPGKGELMIFNRSHYEDLLVVRARNLVPKNVWAKRFGHINDFERMLSDEGTRILKFFLHIDKAEQHERLNKRLSDPDKLWKFNIADVKERALWPEYVRAYEDVLSKTSTPWAPWYIIPANVKWYRNLVISGILVDALKKLKMKYPRPQLNLRDIKGMMKKR
jgi:PPK2 family polyphosphate:nucleotide phosphotransferase